MGWEGHIPGMWVSMGQGGCRDRDPTQLPHPGFLTVAPARLQHALGPGQLWRDRLWTLSLKPHWPGYCVLKDQGGYRDKDPELSLHSLPARLQQAPTPGGLQPQRAPSPLPPG